MSTKHYVNENGEYLGGFGDGAKPPDGAVKVSAPKHGKDTYDHSKGKWTHYAPTKVSDPDIDGALRLLAVGHPNQAAIEALLNRKT